MTGFITACIDDTFLFFYFEHPLSEVLITFGHPFQFHFIGHSSARTANSKESELIEVNF